MHNIAQFHTWWHTHFSPHFSSPLLSFPSHGLPESLGPATQFHARWHVQLAPHVSFPLLSFPYPPLFTRIAGSRDTVPCVVARALLTITPFLPPFSVYSDLWVP